MIDLLANAITAFLTGLFQLMDSRQEVSIGEASFGNCSHLGEAAEGVEQVKQRGVSGAKLAFEIVGPGAKQFGNLTWILMRPWRGNDEADAILASPAGATRHLLQFRRGQRFPAAIAAAVSHGDHDAAGREIHAGSYGRGSENR